MQAAVKATHLSAVQLDGALELQLLGVSRARHIYLPGDVEVHDNRVGGAQVRPQLDGQPLQCHPLCHCWLHQRHFCL